VIHTTHQKSSLSNQNRTLSLKPAHQDPLAITYKTTKQTKNNFFNAFETPHHQQFNHIVELGFATFIHKKHITLFLSYMSHYGLAIYIKMLRQKKNNGNSNISPCKNIIFEKSSKRDQNLSKYCNYVTNLKFQHKPKYHLSKILI
jgi:hypothetical protein